MGIVGDKSLMVANHLVYLCLHLNLASTFFLFVLVQPSTLDHQIQRSLLDNACATSSYRVASVVSSHLSDFDTRLVVCVFVLAELAAYLLIHACVKEMTKCACAMKMPMRTKKDRGRHELTNKSHRPQTDNPQVCMCLTCWPIIVSG